MAARVQRVAAYAVVIRHARGSGPDGSLDGPAEILLSRLAPRVSRHEVWTLPGGGLDHGEDPRDAVVRELFEETGLAVTVGETAHTYSLHLPDTWRKGRRVDAHSLRIVYEGWVPVDSPPPRVVEVDGSTVEAAWHPLDDVVAGSVPTVSLVQQALHDHRPHQRGRLSAYALLLRERTFGPEVLLVRNSPRGPVPGAWTLPGGGVEHGELPGAAVVREVHEEAGLDVEVGALVTERLEREVRTAGTGREEDYGGVQLVYAARVVGSTDGALGAGGTAVPHVVEVDGTVDAARWVPLADVTSAVLPVRELVRVALAAGLEQVPATAERRAE